MDPIGALSLVANVFAVISFTGELVKTSLQIHERGTVEELDDLNAISTNSITATERLKTHWQSTRTRLKGKGNEVVSSLDPQLNHLTKEVLHVATDLADLHQQLHRRTKKATISSAILTTFRLVWKKEDIVKIQQRLQAAKDELQFYLIVLVKTNLDENKRDSRARDNILQSLDETTKDGLRQAAVSLQSIEGKGDAILAAQHTGEASAQDRHEELLRFIRSLSINELAQDPRSYRQVETMFSYVGQTRQERVNAVVVSSLWFPTMRDREDKISEAHKETYNWIYQDPEMSYQSWDSFGRFLRSSSGLYWITGKPGAGKSTLMKYINRSDKTSKALTEWAGLRRLTVARFYFYYNGTKMQKSEIGVLRSLLHQILEKRPKIVQRCFPDRFRLYCFAPEDPQTFTPTVWELKRALKNLVEPQDQGDCFFFSVDGLDEYDADDSEMALLVKIFDEFSSLPNVKSLLSSRPLQTFEVAFAKSPKLRLHELTRPDISAFVMAKISKHPALERLMGGDAETSQKFIDEIVDASSGVFLWVHLVVRSLLVGLQNFDDLSDLYGRLRELPSDLEDLYRHMWLKIPPRYRCQASMLLQLVEAATIDGGRLSVMGLSFANDSDQGLCHKIPVAPLPEEEVKSRYEITQGRIASRCMGLVEIGHLPFAPSPLNNGGNCNTDLYDNSVEYSKYKHPHAVFIHRTISEFISNPEIRGQLVETTPGFNAETALFSSAVCRIKTYLYSGLKPDGLPKSLEALIYHTINRAVKAEASSRGERQTELLLELDRAITTHVREFLPEYTHHWSGLLTALGDVGSWRELNRVDDSSLLRLAVRYGLLQYVRDEINRDPSILFLPGRSLLDYALRPYCLNPALTGMEIPRKPEMIQALLSGGCDPNTKFAHSTIWETFLVQLIDDAKRDSNYFNTTPTILQSLLKAGVATHVSIYVTTEADAKTVWRSPVQLFKGMHQSQLCYGSETLPPNRLGFEAAMAEVIALAEKTPGERRYGHQARRSEGAGAGAGYKRRGMVMNDEQAVPGEISLSSLGGVKSTGSYVPPYYGNTVEIHSRRAARKDGILRRIKRWICRVLGVSKDDRPRY